MEVVILAGGLGTRLRSVVSEVPKCMAPVGGHPFLYYLLRQVAQMGGVSRVVLSVGYLREVIFRWIDSVRDVFPFAIDYAVEDVPLGTGGGIRLALSHCTADEVLVMNGDTYFAVDAAAMQRVHRIAKPAITIALKPMRDFDRYGAVEMVGQENGAIRRFCEKEYRDEGLINGGVYLVSRDRLDMSALPDKFSFETEVLLPLAGEGRLLGVVQRGYFIDIGIPSDYARADAELGCDTLLLDRDGTINVLRPADYVKSWDEFIFRPDFLRLCADWANHFRHIFVVTNQRGVGRGRMTEDALAEIHRRMAEEVGKAGGRIDGIYYCTAVDDSDPRRKPNSAMWDEIRHDHPDVSAERTLMVGDSDGDAEFARRCGIRFQRV